MFKLVKYDIRRNIVGLALLFALFAILEVYFGISVAMKNEDNTVLATLGLMLASIVAFFGVFTFGVVAYSKELKTKSGYLTFMTPKSSLSIIASKLISTFIVGTFFVALIVILATVDYPLFMTVFPDLEVMIDILGGFVENANLTLIEVFLAFMLNIIEFLLVFLLAIALAYMSITLSSTLFQNKKFKGIISAVLFLAILAGVNKIAEYLPTIHEVPKNTAELCISLLPSLGYALVISLISIFVTAKLLDKRVSL